MAVDPLADLKVALLVTGSSDDALLTQLNTAAQSFVDRFCGRSFAGGTFVEFFAGAHKMLFLRNYPVASVVSLRVDATGEFAAESIRPAATYVLYPDRGVVANRDGPFVPVLSGWDLGPEHFPNAVRVEYSTPTLAVPPDVQRAHHELVGHWYRQAKTMNATEHRNLLEHAQDGGQTVYPWNQSVGFKLPEGVLQLLRPYRIPGM